MRAVAIAIVLLLIGTACGSAAARLATTSRDGQRFLVEFSPRLSASGAQIDVVAEDGHVLRHVADVAFDSPVALSPNRKLLAWSDSTDVVVERIDGTHRRVLGATGPFAWSPDSASLLASSRGALVVVSVATGAKRKVLRQRGLSFVPVAWLGSGKILFDEFGVTGNGNETNGGPIRLVVAESSGASPRVLYEAAETIHDSPHAYASPNGKWVVNMTDGRDTRDPTFELIDVATGKAIRLASYSGYESAAWAPDSSRVLVGDAFGPLQEISSRGKVVQTIHQNAYVPVAWTPRALYLLPGPPRSDGEEPERLFAIPVGQETVRTVFTLAKQWILLVEPL